MESICVSESDLYVPINIEENDLYPGITKLLQVLRPSWTVENINFKVFTDGITNKLVACKNNNNSSDNSDVVLVRIYGNKTDLLIDRNAELRNIKVLNKAGLAPQVYGVFKNGIAYEYYPGSTLTPASVLEEHIWTQIATRLAKMHKVNLGDDEIREPMLWGKIEQFLNLLPEPFTDPEKQKRFVHCFGSVSRLSSEYGTLKARLSGSASPLVLAHNDLLLGNVVHNHQSGHISFIDFEYAAYNYQAFDIANHFNEFVGLNIEDIDYSLYPNSEFQRAWIRTYLREYLGSEPAAAQVERLRDQVDQFVLASHFLWGVWSLVQYQLSHIDFDFGRYAEVRFQRYLELKASASEKLS